MIVKVIASFPETKIVEWVENGEVYRTEVPSDEVTPDGFCSAPERGLKWGESWADMILAPITPEEIERSLHQHGVWTVEDLHRRPSEAQGAIVALAGEVLQQLLQGTKHRLKGK